MADQSYSKHIYINADKNRVFDVITKQIDKWWTESSNKINKVGDKLVVQFENDSFWEMVVVDYSPGISTEWKVINANHNLESLSKKDEWKNTSVKWEISEEVKGSKLSINHKGLIPKLECYDICVSGWDYFLESLKKYIESGLGTPNKK